MARGSVLSVGSLVVLALGAFAPCARAGKLQDLRDRTDSNSDSSNSDDDDDDDDDGCNWLQYLLSACPDEHEVDHDRDQAQREPVFGSSAPADASLRPSALLADTNFFLPYPYAEGNSGNSLQLQLPPEAVVSACRPDDRFCTPEREIMACINDVCFESPEGRHVELPAKQRRLQNARAQLFADVGEDTDGLRRGTLGLVLDSNRILGVDTRWTYWVEPLSSEALDSLWLGDVNLRFGALMLPKLQLAFSGGVRVLTGGGSQVGFNGGASLELYPFRPVVLRSEFDAGNLGPALFWEGQGSLGLVLQRYELYVGASHFQVMDVQFDSAFAGMRVHL